MDTNVLINDVLKRHMADARRCCVINPERVETILISAVTDAVDTAIVATLQAVIAERVPMTKAEEYEQATMRG